MDGGIIDVSIESSSIAIEGDSALKPVEDLRVKALEEEIKILKQLVEEKTASKPLKVEGSSSMSLQPRCASRQCPYTATHLCDGYPYRGYDSMLRFPSSQLEPCEEQSTCFCLSHLKAKTVLREGLSVRLMQCQACIIKSAARR